MSRKNILATTAVETSKSMAASFNGTPTIIDYMDGCAYQINVTTTDSVGTFTIQGSLDYVPANSAGAQPNSGNWADLSLGGDLLTVAAANDVMLIKLDMVPFHALRVVYTSSVAGTGTCTILMQNKNLGS